MPQEYPRIPTGLKAKVMEAVDESMLATTLGSGDVDVLGTPAMVALMEKAAVEALSEALPDDYTSVGVVVDVRHDAPTPLGMNFIAIAEVVEVEDRLISFAISVWDEIEEVGECFHQRMLVEREPFQKSADARLIDPRRGQ